ncbi:glycosyltransferase family 2 protein [Pedobacter agri]|uniref:glycosyltransferase family 2 protein n=1 Tax=Pedobacter agri TaxID=454586 RepID=UPI00292CE822|nr:glycosyltransferase family 2 protein [Pedobacter agri]
MKITVILCTFNGVKYLEEQILSILNQTKKVNKIQIFDDQSDDNTVEIISKFADKYPHIIYFHQNERRLGTKKNFELGIKLCESDIFFLADQDDIWEANKVEIIIDFFNKNPNALLVFTNATLIDKDGHLLDGLLWEKWNFTHRLKNRWKNNFFAFNDLIMNNNKVTGATVAFRHKLKISALPFYLPYGYWHDAWLALHAAGNNGLFFLDSCLVKYRLHTEQQIGINSISNPGNPGENFKDNVSKDFFINKISLKYKFHYLVFKLIKKINGISHKIKSF